MIFYFGSYVHNEILSFITGGASIPKRHDGTREKFIYNYVAYSADLV